MADMCHADEMSDSELSEDEKDTLRRASFLADDEARAESVVDIVQIIVNKHVAQRSADMTARFQQSLDEYLVQQQEGVL